MKLSDNAISNINNVRNVALRNLQPYEEANRALINNFADQLINGDELDLTGLKNGNLDLYPKFSFFLNSLIRLYSDLDKDAAVLDESNEWIQLIIKNDKNPIGYSFSHYPVHDFIRSRLKVMNRPDTEEFISFLKDSGYAFEQILILVMQGGFPFTYTRENISEDNLNGLALIIRERILAGRTKSLMKSIFGKKESIIDDLLNCNLQSSGLSLTKFLSFIDPVLVDENLEKLLVREPYHGTVKRFSISVAKYLLEIDFDKYSDELLDVTVPIPFSADTHYGLALELAEKNRAKYHDHAMEMGDALFERMIKLMNSQGSYYAPRVRRKPSTITYLDYIYAYDPEVCYTKLSVYLESMNIVPVNVITFIGDHFGEDKKNARGAGGELLHKCLNKESGAYSSDFYYSLFQNFKKVDFADRKDDVLDFLVSTNIKRARYEGAKALSKYAIPLKDRSIKLLGGKVIGERLTGALILANAADATIKSILNEAVDKEKNDETRNIMLESLHSQRFEKKADVKGILEMVDLAQSRKKLAKWSEKWIEEENLPKLYWQNGNVLDQYAIRFLFYRMKQVKGISSDVEAKHMLQVIDSAKSEKFALFLLQAFIDSNADTKYKYYLTLCGLLGSDMVLNKLHALFRKSITDKRVKMAEYVLGAIAMIGSDKALRILEVISRKYANKKPKLSQTAIASLNAAAQELGITKDQLADRIIPNFDFDGIFKEFDVDGETYRAFIGQEFKLVYYNEDNKMRKSVPKGTDPVIKKEFTAIGKEVRDIVKSQGDRLERYMNEGRKWEADNWRTFFFENPIMFVYAMKLLWLVEDAEGEFKEVFYCDEDAEMYDVEDEEVEIEATDKISILHPLNIKEDLLKQWKEKATEDDIETIFPILYRPIFHKLAGELESHSSSVFDGHKIPKGADAVAPILIKRGWYKHPADGGTLEFTKKSGTGVTAFPYIEGPMAYYQGGEVEARIYTIAFIGKDWRDKILIKDVPPVFYSEVIADLDFLIKAN